MPTDIPVDFLAVDEVQLAADRERGHIFTDRLLHARGRRETMFLGADTIRPILRHLVPGVEIISRPRLSTLRRYVPPRKLEKVPPRSALIVFSIAELYTVAERLRSRAGGAALSSAPCRLVPATRRSPCSSRAKSIISSRPTPSAWA